MPVLTPVEKSAKEPGIYSARLKVPDVGPSGIFTIQADMDEKDLQDDKVTVTIEIRTSDVAQAVSYTPLAYCTYVGGVIDPTTGKLNVKNPGFSMALGHINDKNIEAKITINKAMNVGLNVTAG